MHKNFNFPFRPLFFFQEATKISNSETSYSFAQRRVLGKLFCEFLFLKILRVVEINFYLNFLSLRKYDWNVAPKDLEKYGAPTAHASYFF